jgi:hypothetical protein
MVRVEVERIDIRVKNELGRWGLFKPIEYGGDSDGDELK